MLISDMHSKVLVEGTQLLPCFRHRDTASNAKAIKMLLKDRVSVMAKILKIKQLNKFLEILTYENKLKKKQKACTVL